MSIRAVHGSLGVVCAIGLAVVGIGWRTEMKPQPAPPKRVYCNIDELVKYHPAWDQLAETRLLASRSDRSDSAQFASGGAASVTVPDLRGPEPGSATRTALKASLERRTEEELAKISDQLNTSVARQLAEKRKELEARADASDAEAKRQAEQTIAQDLRALDEEHRYERVDEAIKLAALKAQLSVQGVSHDPIKAAIESKEKQLSSLSGEEERLRQKAAAELEAARVQRRDATEKELADLQASESRRVAASVQSRREKLRKDLDGSGLDVLTGKYSGSLSVAPAGAGAASRAVRERLEAESAFIGSVSASSRDLADLRQSLRTRMNSELRAVVTRIARENGLEVTFRPDDRSQDRTDWFRTRLPYVTARRAS